MFWVCLAGAVAMCGFGLFCIMRSRNATPVGFGAIALFIGVLFLIVIAVTHAALATWKPEYAQSPEAVQRWFKEARVAGGCDGAKAMAWHRLGICGCCEQSERLMTKFVAAPNHQWSYYPDPNCTTKGCELKAIPNDVVHDDDIHALEGDDDTLPEFDAMRREGVLFIYHGAPSCFWPPESGI